MISFFLHDQRHQEKLEQEIESRRKPEKFKPNSNYKDKYAHLIGQDAALDAAKKTETNKQYGFGKFIQIIKIKSVPSIKFKLIHQNFNRFTKI